MIIIHVDAAEGIYFIATERILSWWVGAVYCCIYLVTRCASLMECLPVIVQQMPLYPSYNLLPCISVNESHL